MAHCFWRTRESIGIRECHRMMSPRFWESGDRRVVYMRGLIGGWDWGILQVEKSCGAFEEFNLVLAIVARLPGRGRGGKRTDCGIRSFGEKPKTLRSAALSPDNIL